MNVKQVTAFKCFHCVRVCQGPASIHIGPARGDNSLTFSDHQFWLNVTIYAITL